VSPSLDRNRARESTRHARQVILPGVGEAGQRRLRASHALIVGCGALGSAVAATLCRAGVGTLTIVDRDIVEETNLQRQTLFTERDARDATPKAEAARRRLNDIDSAVHVRAVVADLNQRNAEAILGGRLSTSPSRPAEGRREEGPPVDIILDGADNFETRYLLNDLAVRHRVPLVYAGVIGTRGMTMNALAGAENDAPCLRCVFESPPPSGAVETCETAGVFGPAVQTITGIQAAEALKILLGAWDDVSRDLVEIDVWSNESRRVSLAAAKRDDCPCCAHGRLEYLEGARGGATAVLCGRGAVQVGGSTANGAGAAIDLESLAMRLARVGEFTANEFLVRGVLSEERGDEGEPIELTVFRDGRAIVKGTKAPERARAVYSRFIGD